VDAPFAAHLLLLAGARERLALEAHGLRTLIRIGYGLDENAGNYGKRLDPWLVHESAVDAAEPELDEGAEVRVDASLRLRALGLALCTKRPQCARCPIANLCDLSRLIGKNR
jgi:endonuclease III